MVFKIGSQSGLVNGEPFEIDTVPVMYQNSIFIPLGFLTKTFEISSQWDQINKLYSLTGEDLTTEMVKYYEDLDTREGPVTSNNGFMPISYLLDIAHSKITIKSKNVTGTDLPEGVEDVHPYFIYGNSAQFDKVDRLRPAVKKDGFTDYTWTITPGKVDGKQEVLKYILVKGRTIGQ